MNGSALNDFAKKLVARVRIGRRWFFYNGNCIAFRKALEIV